tara:strand:- start:238 stop:1461 length:1224 start_codon:yes stop_codon:yes gene_type:complete
VVKKLFKILKTIFNSKLIFESPKKYDLVIFDCTSLVDLQKYLLEDENYFVLKNRYQNINEVYLSAKIIFRFITNLRLILKKNVFIQDIYFLSIIQFLQPKVVFTFIDNSFQFSKLCKINTNKNIKFVALQNGARYQRQEQQVLFNKKLIKKNLNLDFYMPHYLCFGEFEKDDCIKHQIYVGEFTFVGSLRLANFLNDLKLNKVKIKKNKYDICLISDHGAWLNDFGKIKINDVTQAEVGVIKLIKYTIQFCIKKNLKLILVFKRKVGKPGYKEEQMWFKENFSEKEYNYILNNSQNNDGSSSYKCSFESKVSIANMSTLLRENIACGNKILSCNLSNSGIYNFPLKGICSLNNSNYEQFESRLSNILKLSSNDYFSKIEKDKNYLIHTDNPEYCFKIIRKTINKYLL